MRSLLFAALLAFSLLLPASAQQPVASLAQVRTIYVPIEPPKGLEPYWTADVRRFQQWLAEGLALREKAPKYSGRKWQFKGDCSTGFPTIIPDLRLVCSRDDADAMLIGDAWVSGYDSRVRLGINVWNGMPTTNGYSTNPRYAGDVVLYARGTGSPLWSPSLKFKSMAETARRAARQLKKDIEGSRKAERN